MLAYEPRHEKTNILHIISKSEKSHSCDLMSDNLLIEVQLLLNISYT